MEYLNFEIRIGTEIDGRFPISVIYSPVGEVSSLVNFSIKNSQFKLHLDLIEKKSRNNLKRKSAIDSRRLEPIFEDIETSIRTVGSNLFSSFFSGSIYNCYQSSYQIAHQKKKGLRILLRIETPILAALPWEYLYDTDRQEYLNLSIKTPIVRYLELPIPQDILQIKPPINILIVIASPNDLPLLDVEKEKAQISNALEYLVEKGSINITWLNGQTWRALQSALRSQTWHILHFIGHGSFEKSSGEGTIALVGDDGSTYSIKASQLGRLLADNYSMKMVVLNSCEGAQTNTTNLFSSVSASLMKKGIPTVISMQYEITDYAALEFSRTFYDCIGKGFPVDLSMQESRKAMDFALNDNFEWGTPILTMRTRDGNFFKIDYKNAIFNTPSIHNQSVPPWEKLSTVEHDKVIVNLDEQRGLNNLMKKVRNFWIEGVLESSIQPSILIDLGLETMPSMIDSPWGDLKIEEADSIYKTFNKVGRSMLILGEPGAGKTTQLLRLTRELINHNNLASFHPIPTVFNLSSWVNSEMPLSKWLEEELSMKYMIPKQIGGYWLKNGRLIIMLDGLDEVKKQQRNDCVLAINDYMQNNIVTGLVVCSRFREYIELDARLEINVAIRLQLLSKQRIFDFLNKAGNSYSGLINLLKVDSTLVRLAETPFILSLMMKTYEGINLDNEIPRRLSFSIKEKKRELMEAYVNRQFRSAKSINIPI